jgi:hypothetical protein
VLLDGNAVGPGVITFAPVGETHNPAIGTVEAKGSYSLATNHASGLPAGKYRASLYIHKMPPDAKPGERLMSTPSAIPAKYESVETSELEYDVAPGNNTIDITLTSK